MKTQPVTSLAAFCLAVIACLAVLITSCQWVGRPTAAIALGAILPMTGSGAQYGEEVRRGIDIALAEVNSKGGINNTPLKLALEDSATDPKTAVFAFEKLTADRSVQVIVTEVSGVVLALAPRANEKKVILLNVGATNPKIREAGPYVFSNINDATVETKFMAGFAFTQLKAKKAAVLYTEVAYGQGAREVFAAAFKALGGAIVAEVPFREQSLDFRAQLGQVRRAAPEVVYLTGHTRDLAKILKQAYEMRFRPQWISNATFEGEDVVRIAGQASEGVIYAFTDLGYQHASVVAKRFTDSYRAKYSADPGIYCATGYDAAMLTYRATSSVGNDATKIRQRFLSMEPFEGASGITKFLPNGAVEKPLFLKTVRNGEFVPYQQ